jgi:predicted nucleic acid-binding protein
MNAYADASALVKLLLRERDVEEALDAWRSVDEVFSSEVAYVELRAALAAARRSGRGTGSGPEDDRLAAEDLWEELLEITLDSAVLADAVRLVVDRALHALDAIHLASALAVKGDGPIAFICFDRRLREAAHAEGLIVLPEAA